MKWFAVPVAAALSLAATQAAAVPYTIDAFQSQASRSTNGIGTTCGTVTPRCTEVAAPFQEIANGGWVENGKGWRDVIVQKTVGNDSSFTSATTGSGVFNFFNGQGGRGRADIVIDGSDGGFAAGTSLAQARTVQTDRIAAFDVTAGGTNTGVGISDYSSLGNIRLTLEGYNNSGGIATYSSVIASTNSILENLFIPFSSFTASGSALNVASVFSALTGFRLSLSNVNAADTTLSANASLGLTFFGNPDDFAPVPLPASAWMLLAALGAAGIVARRRSARA